MLSCATPAWVREKPRCEYVAIYHSVRLHRYSYQDGDDFVFMDTTTFETINVPSKAMGNAANYMTEGLEVD